MLVLVAVGGGFGIWKYQAQRAKALKIESETLRTLTEQDLVDLLKSQELVEPSRTYAVVRSEESRKSFLKGMREYLALAARARGTGLDEQPNIKRLLEYKRDALLSVLYLNKLDNEKGSFFEVPKDRIEAYLNDPANVAEYAADQKAINEIQRKVAKSTGNPLAAPSAGSDEAQVKNRDGWAKTKILASMAKTDTEFISQPIIRLRLRVNEAGVLATNYLNEFWAEKIKPTDAEIDSYLAEHPEFDLKAKREVAELVLARALKGEDFAALAKEFSEDRSTRGKGGAYENVEPGFLWNEVQETLLTLENGRFADRLIETKDGWHIVQLINKTIKKRPDGTDMPVLNMRHILLQRRFPDPFARTDSEVPPPFLTPREIAEAAVRSKKRETFVASILASESLSLPEDFNYPVTDELKNSGVRVENKLEEIKREEREAIEAKKKAAAAKK